MSKSKSQKNSSIQAYISYEQYESVKNKAEDLGLNVSNYVRLLALHTNVEIKLEIIKTILEMPKSQSKHTVQARLSPEQYELVKMKATNSGLNIGDYIKLLILYANVEIKLNYNIENTIDRTN